LSLNTPDIGCGYMLDGGAVCGLRWKHDGEHEPAEVILVDRRLRPLNRNYVVTMMGSGPVDARNLDERSLDFATVHQYKGREEVWLGSNFEDSDRGTEMRPVNRPAVRVGDRWVRRCPTLEVVAA
jgi:hypothetical protein